MTLLCVQESRDLNGGLNISSLASSSLGPNLGIRRATSGTISAMMDDFNRAIETLDLSHDPDLMESTIRANRATLNTTTSNAARIDAKNKQQQQLQLLTQQPTAKTGSQPTRRASTGGAVDSLDLLLRDRVSLKQGKISSSASSTTSTSTTTSTSFAASTTTTTSHQPEVATATTASEAALTAAQVRQLQAAKAASSAIEAQLAKQQQVLISQQQQFLQLQLEQQRLQSVMHEQMERSAKQLELDKAEAELVAAQAAQRQQMALLQQQQAQLQQQMMAQVPVPSVSTSYSASTMAPEGHPTPPHLMMGREGGLAGGIYKVEHDLLYGRRDDTSSQRENGSGRGSREGVKRTVLKSDKQVSTSTPPSLNSTPTSSAEPSRLRDGISTFATTTGSGQARRALPQPNEDAPCPMPTSVTAYHHQQQKAAGGGGISGLSISANNSPLLSRRSALQAQQAQMSSGVATSGTSVVKNAIGGKPSHSASAGGLPAPGATAVSSYPGSLLSGSGRKGVGPTEQIASQKSGQQSQALVTSLGYLDLDTKNVTFDRWAGRRRRHLPTAPREEDPIASTIATRRLIKEKLISGKFFS